MEEWLTSSTVASRRNSLMRSNKYNLGYTYAFFKLSSDLASHTVIHFRCFGKEVVFWESNRSRRSLGDRQPAKLTYSASSQLSPTYRYPKIQPNGGRLGKIIKPTPLLVHIPVLYLGSMPHVDAISILLSLLSPSRERKFGAECPFFWMLTDTL